MEFKSAKDMKYKYMSDNKKQLTDEELDWIKDLKMKIKSKLDDIYNNESYINFTDVYSSKIPDSAVQNGGSEKLFEEIKYLERELISLGYKVSSEFAYNRGLADSYALYLSWGIK